MRPVDFIGRVVRGDNQQLVSHVEGTIFQYEDKLAGHSGWQGSFLRIRDQDALLAAGTEGQRLLLLCNDGRQGEIILEPEMADWGMAGLRFAGRGVLSAPTKPPSWRNLDRTRAEDGDPD